MQRYWDLTTKEKAALTREELEPYIRVELMEQGVVVPPPPKLEPIEEVQIGKHVVYKIVLNGYTYLDVAFERAEDAQALLMLHPLHLRSEYAGGEHVSVATPLDRPAVTGIDVSNADDLECHQEALKRNAVAKKHNDEATREYDKARKAAAEASSGMLSDWLQAQSTEAHHRRIRATLDEYVTMAGDRAVAMKFLVKAFNADDIEEATGEKVPPVEPREETPPAADEVAF